MEKGRARNTIIVLDTITKFTNTMSKDASREFSLLIRPFVLRGGTVIALGHTNKHVSPNGDSVYAGTSDLVNDFDCAYVLTELKAVQAEQKVVEFKNIKRRGNNALKAAYSYGVDEKDYLQLLMTVSKLEEDVLKSLEAQGLRDQDDTIVAAIRQAIKTGKNTKMVLLTAVREAAGISRRSAETILTRYTGANSHEHYWQVETRAHGRMEYRLLEQPSELPARPAEVLPAEPPAAPPTKPLSELPRPTPTAGRFLAEKPAALLTGEALLSRMGGDY